MKSLAKKDAGVIEGGSKLIAENIEKRFINNGGTLIKNKEVERILVEDNTAKGVVFKDGSVVYADYVISATDAHHAMYDLLEGKYKDEYFASRFGDRKVNPLSTSMLVSFKVNKTLNHLPKMINFKIPTINFGPMDIKQLSVRNHSFDNSLSIDKTTITVLINTVDEVYDYLKVLNRKDYLKEKEELGQKVREEIINYTKIDNEDIELIDVATPLTYERYTNAYRGSYMSFVTTEETKGLMRKGLIKGLNNFVMAGQWIMSPGGLPIALFSGKHAACRLCKMAKKKFVNLEE
jgi:phytoene dehydrogenase-like protein